MRIRYTNTARHGVILPYLAISMVALLTFVALAIDLGMVMVAKTQAQNAADAAAFAAARSLTGAASANTTQATLNGQAAAAANRVAGTSVPATNVTIVHGAYHYDPGSQTFYPQFPPVAPDNYNLSQATIVQGNATYFAKVFGMTSYNVTATATAAHRPRDTCIVLDFSGSMNNESDLWNCEAYQGSYQNSPNNTDPVFPQWGYYNTTFSPLATIQCTASSDLVGYCNITQSVGGCGAMVNDYYQNARGASASAAFASATTFASITAPANVNAGFSSALTLPSVTVSSTQPAGDQAQTTYRSPPQNTYGQTIASSLGGRTAKTTVLAANDIVPSGYGNGTSGTPGSNPGPYNGINLWGSAPFGYTLGPKYWGMTFFTWPPDPNNDWRQLYFLSSNGTPWLNSLGQATVTSTSNGATATAYPSNSALFASNGSLNSPSGNYQINYKQILAWISANLVQQTAGDGRPFPPILRSSNTVFYSYIPTDVPASAYTWSNGNSGISDSSVRFWKEYIDFALGVWSDPFGNIQTPGNPSCSYGPDYTAGFSSAGQNVSISGPDSTIYINGLVNFHPSVTNSGSGYTSAPTITFNNTGTNGSGAAATATVSGGKVTAVTLTNPGSGYTKTPTISFSGGGGTNAAATATLQTYTFMNPSDNPQRPRHRLWFSPMTMIQYMADTGIFPGVTTDISMLPAKLGIQGALQDVQNNHPNDMLAMLMFSRPHYNGEPTEAGQFTYPVNSLSRNYTGMINSLWYPPNGGSADVTPWDANGLLNPHAHGDYDANTATSYGLMLAYNQFSSSSVLSGGSQGGGLGRKGAQRLLILETDGMANQASTVSFVNSVTTGSNPTNNSYYNIGGNNASASGADPSQDAINVATKMCALVTDSSNGPGFATAAKSVVIHCIAFGALFEADANGAAGGNAAMSLLQNLSTIGGTGFPASVTDTGSPYYYKLCIGTLAQRQSKLQTAFTTIMDDGIAIIMVK
jgi:Flp pilus assembly protein TadG